MYYAAGEVKRCDGGEVQWRAVVVVLIKIKIRIFDLKCREKITNSSRSKEDINGVMPQRL